MSIERLLDKRGISYSTSSTYYQVSCLSPDHEDKNPSMFINKFTGWANCKSCGVSYNVYELFDERPNWLEVRKHQLRDKIQKVGSDTTSYEIPATAVFWDSFFKGIRPSVIQEFQGFQSAEFPGYLCFPLRDISGKIVNFIGRDTTGTKNNKYMFFYTKGPGLCPKDNDYKGSVILVEGWFDALNLYQHGLTNARALLGAKGKFNQEHLDSLKIEGISEVIIMLDSDKAGQETAKDIKHLLDANYIENKNIKLPEGTDPGELSQSTVLKIKEQLYGKSSVN